MMELDERHYSRKNRKQRITKAQWRDILLRYDEKIIFEGNVCKLKAKDIGYGVVEISKDLEKEK